MPRAPAYFQHFLERLVPPTAAHHPSMLQDLQQGRRTEIEALNGAICRYAVNFSWLPPQMTPSAASSDSWKGLAA